MLEKGEEVGRGAPQASIFLLAFTCAAVVPLLSWLDHEPSSAIASSSSSSPLPFLYLGRFLCPAPGRLLALLDLLWLAVNRSPWPARKT
jgi:hypothetical protein